LKSLIQTGEAEKGLVTRHLQRRGRGLHEEVGGTEMILSERRKEDL